ITAQAPAFSAMRAWSALVTSMMTPPLSISAKPTFTRHSLEPLAAPLPLPFTFFESIVLLLSSSDARRSPLKSVLFASRFLTEDNKAGPAASEHDAVSVTNLAPLEDVASAESRFEGFHRNFLIYANRPQEIDVHLCGDSPGVAKAADLAHR